MVKEEGQKGKKTFHKTLHRLNNMIPTKNRRALSGQVVPAPQVVPIMLLMLKIQ
jgi:hypothetical protein